MGKITDNSDGYLYNKTQYYTNGLVDSTQLIDQRKRNASIITTSQAMVTYVEPLTKRTSINLNYTFDSSNSEQDARSYERGNGKYDSLNLLYSNISNTITILTAEASEKKLVFALSQKSLVDTLWVLESFGDPAKPSTPETGTLITAQFSEDGILSGMAGCNNYTTSYVAKDGSMEIEMPASTMRACTKGMEQEAVYLQALTNAESYTIEGTTLEISYDGGQGVLRYTSQHFPLENVIWTLVAMNGDDNLVGQPTTALFELGTEPGTGGVGGAARCNHYAGSYTQDQENLTIENIITSRMSCPEDVMQAESTYLETLGASQSYQHYGIL